MQATGKIRPVENWPQTKWIQPQFQTLFSLTDKMAAFRIVLALTIVCVVQAQRPFYAGLSPIGYPQTAENDLLSNRFGESEPQPIEVRGDGNLVNRFNNMPIDNQPFWYLNWRQYNALRQQPQTYPQRQNSFIDRFRK